MTQNDYRNFDFQRETPGEKQQKRVAAVFYQPIKMQYTGRPKRKVYIEQQMAFDMTQRIISLYRGYLSPEEYKAKVDEAEDRGYNNAAESGAQCFYCEERFKRREAETVKAERERIVDILESAQRATKEPGILIYLPMKTWLGLHRQELE